MLPDRVTSQVPYRLRYAARLNSKEIMVYFKRLKLAVRDNATKTYHQILKSKIFFTIRCKSRAIESILIHVIPP